MISSPLNKLDIRGSLRQKWWHRLAFVSWVLSILTVTLYLGFILLPPLNMTHGTFGSSDPRYSQFAAEEQRYTCPLYGEYRLSEYPLSEHGKVLECLRLVEKKEANEWVGLTYEEKRTLSEGLRINFKEVSYSTTSWGLAFVLTVGGGFTMALVELVSYWIFLYIVFGIRKHESNP